MRLQRRGGIRCLAVCLLFLLDAAAPFTQAADLSDTTPRTAVISAFEPEWVLLRTALHDRKEYTLNGTNFVTGTIEGKPVLLFLSGISMVNAAMTTQFALDHFVIERIVFSGIAGGADPRLAIGDVVVPAEWSEYLESVFAREVKEGKGGYELPPYAAATSTHYGMMFPQPVQIAQGHEPPKKVTWFHVDPAMLNIARAIAKTTRLHDCAQQQCLSHKPKVVVGGNGVSGQAFVDNKAFRQYAHSAFEAEVIDMESAAVAHVAYVNAKPFIAFRTLSDLAGGGAAKNEMDTFFQVAADNAGAVVIAFLKALH
jgi:adenosylhomocysteine nucleosidase